MSFKIGDKVKFLTDGGYPDCHKGQIEEVTDINYDKDNKIVGYYCTSQYDSVDLYMYPRELELAISEINAQKLKKVLDL